MEWFQEFVLRHLTFTGKCFRHCEKSTSMKIILQEPDRIAGAYVCPDGFISQVVYFSLKSDLEWFIDMLSSQVGKENVNRRDVRTASRHGWELGPDAQETLEAELGRGATIKEVYWTRYPKSETEKQQAVSLCIGENSRTGCMKLFMHDRNSNEKLCPACKAR